MLITAGSFRPGRRGPVLGWGISLLVHALLAAMLLHMTARRPDDGPPAKRIDVFLVPPRAVAPAAPAPAAARLPRTRATRAAAAPRPEIAPVTTRADATATAAPAPVALDDAPAFDMAAARGIARAAAREGNPSLVALPKRPPPTLDPGREAREDQLARGIARSSRNDCRSAYAGLGVLAVLPLLKDAVTGTGCKW
jgi:hypothetical protein